MKKLIIIFALLLSVPSFATEYGYLVVIQKKHEQTKHFKTRNIELVNELVSVNCPYFGGNFDAEKISVYLDFKTESSYIYIGKMNVERKKSGKLKFKKIRK